MTTFLIGIMTVIFITLLIRTEKKSKYYQNLAHVMFENGLAIEKTLLKEITLDLNKHIDILYNRQLKEKWTKKLIELEDD